MFKNLGRWLALVVVHVVLFSIGSNLLGPKVGVLTPEEQSGAMLGLLGIAIIDAALVLTLVRTSRLHGWRLMLLVGGAFYFVKTFTSAIEAVYFMPNVTGGIAPYLFAMTIPLTLGLAPFAVWIGGRARASALDGSPGFAPFELGRGQLALRIGLLSALGYPALFFAAGWFIAFRSPELRAFYGGALADTFFGQLVALGPKVYLFEVLRGAMWVGCAIAILRTMRGPWWASTVFVALWFALIQNDVHFVPNPLMPGTVRLFHFIETASSNFVWAWLIGWSLHVGAGRNVPGIDQLKRLAAPRRENHAA